MTQDWVYLSVEEVDNPVRNVFIHARAGLVARSVTFMPYDKTCETSYKLISTRGVSDYHNNIFN